MKSHPRNLPFYIVETLGSEVAFAEYELTLTPAEEATYVKALALDMERDEEQLIDLLADSVLVKLIREKYQERVRKRARKEEEVERPSFVHRTEEELNPSTTEEEEEESELPCFSHHKEEETKPSMRADKEEEEEDFELPDE